MAREKELATAKPAESAQRLAIHCACNTCCMPLMILAG
jgi:hypothetical protein